MSSNDHLSSCSIVLYVMTERWPEAQRYRDAFEKTKRIALELVAAGRHRPRSQANRLIETKLRSTFDEVDINGPGRDEVLRMIGDMAGEAETMWEPFIDEGRIQIFDATDLGAFAESGDWIPADGMVLHTGNDFDNASQQRIAPGAMLGELSLDAIL